MQRHVFLRSPRAAYPFALACALSLTASAAFAQEELDEAPVTTLDEIEPSKQPAPATELASSPPPKLSAEDEKRAREAFELGRQAWDDGRYREAWEHWHYSYRLSRRPALLYNVGQAADRLRMDAEALEAFRLYLAKNPDAENRREVENRIRILEQAVGAKQGSAQPETLSENLEGEPVASEEAPDDTEASPFGQPQRKGLYARLGLGVGFLSDGFDNGTGTDITATNLTLDLDAGLGYGVSRQFVIGGALLIDWAPAPTADNNGNSVDLNTVRTTLISAFVVYHLQPQVNGWHLLGGIGFGTLALSDASGTFGNEDAGGLGLYLGGGYEIPLKGELAIGVNGRLLLARFAQDLGDHNMLGLAITASVVWY